MPSANASLDVEMPGPARFFGPELLKAVRDGAVSADTIDDKVRRTLTLIQKAGLFDEPRPVWKSSGNTPARRALARKAAAEPIVLLKNEGNVLPLNKRRVKTIAVIGHNAVEARIEGAGSSQVQPYYSVTPLEALQRQCGDGISLTFEMGYRNNRLAARLDTADVRTGKERGLKGEYYASTDLSGKPFGTRVERSLVLRFARTTTSPRLEIDQDTRSARWTGKFTPGVSGVHTFGPATDGLVLLKVGNKKVFDGPAPPQPQPGVPRAFLETQASLPLTKGKAYDMLVEYRSAPDRPAAARRYIQLGCDPPQPPDIETRAVEAAGRADVAIMFAGNNEQWESEGFDRQSLEMPCGQAQLIERIAAVNKQTVVVLNNGAPVDMRGWVGKVAAIVEAWFPGQECGNAIADVLFGRVNPCGKLPVTFPVRLEDTPAYINYPGEAGKVLYGEGIFNGYRYYDKKDIAPQFPFGFGLSYTAFAYSNLRVGRIDRRGAIKVSVDVKNTGRRAGKEVVQVYVRDIAASVIRSPKELKAFDKVALKPGETQTVRLTLDRRSFSYYDIEKKDWVIESGEFMILVGGSSSDIRAQALVFIQ